MKTLLRFASLGLLLFPFAADAGRAPAGKAAVEQAVASYAKARGIRPTSLTAEITGTSASGKSTLATITVGGQSAHVAINTATNRVQSHETAKLIDGLVTAHAPLKRAETTKGSAYATKVLAFDAGRGVEAVSFGGKLAPLGRPRAGQSRAAQSLDALSLGYRGSVTVSLGTPVTAGMRGAGLRVLENGIGNGDDIINQTPGLVEVTDGSKWYRLGYAGYKTAGDLLLTKNAIDAIPAGTTLIAARVTDAPNAPHPHGMDPTDNATASARGVRGFDLVSVQSVK